MGELKVRFKVNVRNPIQKTLDLNEISNLTREEQDIYWNTPFYVETDVVGFVKDFVCVNKGVIQAVILSEDNKLYSIELSQLTVIPSKPEIDLNENILKGLS